MRISDWSSDVCSSDLGAGKELFGKLVHDLLLDHALERAGSELWIVTQLGQPVEGLVRGGDLYAHFMKLLLQLLELHAHDQADLFPFQRAEHDALVHAVKKLGRATCREGVCPSV